MATIRRRHGLMAAATALCALALTACSAGPDVPATTGAAPDAGSQTVTVWHYFSDPNQVALMDKYAELFETAHPGATVENVFVPYDQMNQKTVNAATTQTGPDVVVFNGAEAATLVLGGALAPIDDYLSAYADKDQLPDSTLHVINGTTYAVQGYVNLLGLWYNADILNELGLQPPTTIDEMESAMAAAKAKGYDGITLTGLPNSQGEWQAYPWLTSDGFSYDNLDEAALAKGLARARNWVEQGWLTQEATTWDQTVPFQTFAAGHTLFAENGNWQMGTAQADAKFKYGIVELPVSDQGKVYLGGEGEGIGAFSKNPDLAWEYLTSSYLAPAGGLAASDLVGSLPARLDTAQDPSVTGNELLVPFADTIAARGEAYPTSNTPPEGVNAIEVAMGQAWSSVIGGQSTPEEAAATAIAVIKPAMGK